MLFICQIIPVFLQNNQDLQEICQHSRMIDNKKDVSLIFDYFPDLTDVQRKQFEQLDALYHEWNANINVISRKDIDNLYPAFLDNTSFPANSVSLLCSKNSQKHLAN